MAPPSINWNAGLALGYTGLEGFAGGVWSYNVLSAYIFVLTDNSNTLVGWAEGLQGASQACFALPAGWLADAGRRDAVLWAAGLLGMVAIAVTGYALVLAEPESTYFYLCAGLVLWGAYVGCTNPALEALFADSVRTGARSRIYAIRFALQLGSAGVGPLVNTAFFLWLGNTWTLPELKLVFLVGLGFSLLPCMLLLFFSDDHALGHASEAVHDETDPTTPLLPAPTPAGTAAANPPLGGEFPGNGSIAAAGAEAAAVSDPGMCVPPAWLPVVLATSDCIFGFASGMTIKFFPVFFLHKVGMTPVWVNAMAALTPFLMAAACLAAQRISLHAGRVATSLAFKAIGIALLVCLALLHAQWSNVAITIPVFIARTVLMNSTYPLIKSLLMDYVKKAARARWNSLESVSAFGWSGSAVLGGVLLDRYDFRVTFLLTAALQTLGWAVLLLLLPACGTAAPSPTSRSSMARGGAPSWGAASRLGRGGDLNEPLLGADSSRRSTDGNTGSSRVIAPLPASATSDLDVGTGGTTRGGTAISPSGARPPRAPVAGPTGDMARGQLGHQLQAQRAAGPVVAAAQPRGIGIGPPRILDVGSRPGGGHPAESSVPVAVRGAGGVAGGGLAASYTAQQRRGRGGGHRLGQPSLLLPHSRRRPPAPWRLVCRPGGGMDQGGR